MALRSERFEMRVDEEILDRVDQWRNKQSEQLSRAEAMRRLLELGLGRSSARVVKFSDGEKLLAMMLGDIYRHLKIGGGEIDPNFVSDVIVGGHYWAPTWDMSGLFHSHEDDPRDVSFVVDVLDMWDFIESGYEKLEKKDKDRIEKEAEPFGKYVEFTGFDGNNEATHIGIARFLIEKMNRFTAFKGRELNSHMPTLATYRRMLSVFEPMRNGLIGHGLNATQIIAILKARMYSDTR
jgi:uncharacterized protein YfbU (UPF0304 family)